jgi:hypothetical protein
MESESRWSAQGHFRIRFIIEVHYLYGSVKCKMPQGDDKAEVQDTANNEIQCNRVPRELSLSGDCATGWKMQFTADKCQAISGEGRATYQRESRLHGTVMQRTDQERGLGVIVEKSLKPPAQ